MHMIYYVHTLLLFCFLFLIFFKQIIIVGLYSAVAYKFADVQFLPVSGLLGSNLKTRMDKTICPWWNGPCLFEALDKVEVPLRDPQGAFR